MLDQRPVDRRGFFRAGLRELLHGVSEAVERAAASLSPTVEPVSAPTGMAQPAERLRLPVSAALRPPGALSEDAFLRTCSRCGKCAEVCPSNCIRLEQGLAGGAPRINPDDMPCILCEGLSCMHVCPSGALRLTPRFEIRMGTAVWRAEHCIRTGGEECRICVEKCPLGSAAIDIVNGQVAVNPHHCVGCGMCQHYCPTNPKSVVVIPVAARH